MIRLFYKGHENGAGLKALLELFYGKSEAARLKLGEEILKGFTAESADEVCFLSELGPDSLSFKRLEQQKDGRMLSECLEQRAPASDLRRQIKRQAYRVLSDYSGIRWPWGSLTGIRPTYIADELIREKGSKAAEQILLESYRLKPEKAELALRTAKAEQAILQSLPRRSYAVYVGIPFCPSRCSYCSFTTPEGIGREDSLGDLFLDALEYEIRDFLSWHEALGGRLRALYIGGGTPAALSEERLERLIGLLKRLPLEEDGEVTFEAGRCDVLNERKFRLLRDASYTKICLNPQSLNEETLRRVGRPGSAEDFFRCFETARACGMDNINLDLIAGLDPEPAELLDHLNRLLALKPESITLHTLALKRGSERDLKRNAKGEAKRILPEPALELVLDRAQKRLIDHNYEPYYLYRQKYGRGGLENVAFAEAGRACVYNIMMMSDRFPIVSFGSPAMSKALRGNRIKRLASPKSLRVYLEGGHEYTVKKRELFLSEQEKDPLKTAGGAAK